MPVIGDEDHFVSVSAPVNRENQRRLSSRESQQSKSELIVSKRTVAISIWISLAMIRRVVHEHLEATI